MLTHLASITLSVASRPSREAGFFLADPRRGYMESVSVIPLSVFDQVECALRRGLREGRLDARRDGVSGYWSIERMPALSEIAKRHALALESISADFRDYRGISGCGGAASLLFGADLSIPIADARLLLARSVMSGESPEIIPWLVPGLTPAWPPIASPSTADQGAFS